MAFGVLAENRESVGGMIRVCRHIDACVEAEPSVVEETPAAAPGGFPRPEGEGMKPRGPADGRPRGGVVGSPRSAVAEVDHQVAVGREVAPFLVDSSVEPCARLESVVIGMPSQHVIPFARSTAQDNRGGSVASRDHEEATGGSFHDVPGLGLLSRPALWRSDSTIQ